MYHFHDFPHRGDFVIQALQHDLSLLAAVNRLIIASCRKLSSAFFFDGAIDVFLNFCCITGHNIKRGNAVRLLRQAAKPVVLYFCRQSINMDNLRIAVSCDDIIRFFKCNAALWLQGGKKRKVKEYSIFFFCSAFFLFSHASSSLMIMEFEFASLNRI